MKTLKVLGLLLTYPSAQMIEGLNECRELLEQEAWIDSKALDGLNKLMIWMVNIDLLDLQEEYVSLFDRTPSLSLHIFEHIHGDSKDRGQAMVDLMQVYEESGLVINTRELPDYLPLFLEYLSIIDVQLARENLAEVINVTETISERLKNRNSLYTSVFEAIAAIAACKPDKAVIDKALKLSSGAAFSFEEMDQQWEEHNAFENTQQTTGQNNSDVANMRCSAEHNKHLDNSIPIRIKEA